MRNVYGAVETNPIHSPARHYDRIKKSIFLNIEDFAERGGTITRLRMFNERGNFDISYIEGELPDGTPVDINNLYMRMVPRREVKQYLTEFCADLGVDAEKIGLLDESVWSVLRS